jgi:CHASE1-domain containing sensor protein
VHLEPVAGQAVGFDTLATTNRRTAAGPTPEQNQQSKCSPIELRNDQVDPKEHDQRCDA